MNLQLHTCLAGFALAACAAPPAERAPAALTELYDALAADGALELELERDGTFVELEADVPVETLPPQVRAAALAAYPGVTLTGAEREVQRGVLSFEVKFTHEGRGMELVIDEAGQVRETERELRASEAPLAVLQAAEAALPGSTLYSVESVTSDAGTVYHVKREKAGARYKFILDPAGQMLRKVREARAEIELPLRD